MIIIGIDPGTTSVGYAILEVGRDAPALRAAGLIPTASSDSHERLKKLHHGLNVLMKEWNPDTMALERLFFAKNQKTALAVAEARGVILLTASLARLTLYEYTPLEIKKVISGDGAADKKGVKKMIQLTLPQTKELRARDDVFDAIAVALVCHFKERHTLSPRP